MKSFSKLLMLLTLLAFSWDIAHTQHQYFHNSNGVKITIDYEGKITLSDDDKDITAISDYGYFRFKKKHREVYIKAEADGKLDRTFYVRGRKKAYEPEGKRWLAAELPKLVRRSGFGAESRVAHFYKKGGTNAVLTETGNIETDYAQHKYFNFLLQNHPVKDSELTGIVQSIGQLIKSDYYKGKILRKNYRTFLKNKQTANAYIEAVATIGSSYEKSKALHKALSSNLPDGLMVKVLDASMDIDSDYEKSKVLRGIASKKRLNEKELDKILESMVRIGSDYEKSKVLKTVLERNRLNDKQMVKTIEVIRKIGSDYERSKVLKSVLKRSSPTVAQFDAILNTTSYIGSDYEKAKILVKVGRMMPNNTQLKNKFTKVARSINSDHEYGKVMRSLNR